MAEPSPLLSCSGTLPTFVSAFLGDPDKLLEKTFASSFESETDFKDFYIVPENYQNAATHSLTDKDKVSGKLAHEGVILRSYQGPPGRNNNHRAYPTIQLSKTDLGTITTAALIDFWVKLDVDLSNERGKSWVSLATFSSYDDRYWPRTTLINVDHDYRLHLMHVPQQGMSEVETYFPKAAVLTRNRWAKITAYIDYQADNKFRHPFHAIWLDGTLVSAAKFDDRAALGLTKKHQHPACLKEWDGTSIAAAESLCGFQYKAGLSQLHFGLYAPPGLSSGRVYNDDLRISRVVQKERCRPEETAYHPSP